MLAEEAQRKAELDNWDEVKNVLLGVLCKLQELEQDTVSRASPEVM